MLGVIIGTGTIIGVGAILTGFDGAITNVLRSFGPNSVIVSKTPAFRTTDLTPEERNRKELTYENAIDLREKCSACKQVSPMQWPNHGPIVTKYKGNAVYQSQLRGVEDTYAETGQIEMHRGRFFTDQENRHRVNVAVIGGIWRRPCSGRRSAGQDNQCRWPAVSGDRHDDAARGIVFRQPG